MIDALVSEIERVKGASVSGEQQAGHARAQERTLLRLIESAEKLAVAEATEARRERVYQAAQDARKAFGLYHPAEQSS